MQQWYTPDTIWSIYNTSKTVEDYVENWVVKGHFHAQVHEDIQKSFETVEYLMAHAWYHWPIYDEALKKLMLLFEMAVKIRCEETGIDIKRTNRSGKVNDKNLKSLIDELTLTEPNKDIASWMHRIRELRNSLIHQKNYSFMGGMAIGKVMDLVNMFNLLFLDEAIVKEANDKTILFRNDCEGFMDGLFVLEYNDSRILISEAQPVSVFKRGEDWVSIWHLRPVLTDTFETLSKQIFEAPPILILKQVELKSGELAAVDLETGKPIQLSKSVHPQNEEMMQRHLDDWNRLEESDRSVYDFMLKTEVSRVVNSLVYKYRWEPL